MTRYYFNSIITVLLFSTYIGLVNAQNGTRPVINVNPSHSDAAQKTEILSAKRLDIPLIEESTDDKLFPVLVPLQPKLMDELYFIKNYKDIKDALKLNYNGSVIETNQPVQAAITLDYGIDVNTNDTSIPLDNTIAVSHGDDIISVSNNIIEFYDNNKTLTFKANLSKFINYEMPRPCDPKVIFDPSINRFILFLQRCDGNYSKSQIMVAFSKSEDPLDGWNFYVISGNPMKKSGQWFDFPKIGFSDQSLFISGNIFDNKKFSQSVVYQFDKSKGVLGEDLKYRVWHSFKDKPFTIKPVSYAYGSSFGEGIYMLSTSWNFTGGTSNTMKLYDITGNLYNPSTKVKFFSVPVEPYSFFANAEQKIKDDRYKKIDNGDIRMQDALVFGSKIYYVFTSGNSNNFSRINYNVLELSTLTNSSILIGDSKFHSYAYPSLHFLSGEQEAPQILIQYNGTSRTSFPDIRALTCDDAMNCSSEVVLKAGQSSFYQHDRWGDYSGICKNYETTDELYIVSSYGRSGKRQSFLGKVVPLGHQTTVDPFLYDDMTSSVDLNFSLRSAKNVQVVLNNDGEKRTIFDGKAQKGDNSFQINTKDLEKGNYTLEVIKKNSSRTLGEVNFSVENNN